MSFNPIIHDDDPWCPCPPNPPSQRERLFEAVVVVAATAFFTKVAEFIYDEIKTRRSKRG
jgi:hypothetical protein